MARAVTAAPKGDGVDSPSPVVGLSKPRLLRVLGPGLITGASDDDPSGIATYSQAGAQFGFSITWTLLFTYPLMAAIQEISARLGRTTGYGIATNIRKTYPNWTLQVIVGLLLTANTINIGADLGAMGDATALLIGGPKLVYILVFGVVSTVVQVFLKYTRYVYILKWLTLALFAYFGTVLVVQVPWSAAAKGFLIPTFTADAAFWATIVAILGTTISPYLFFWQASQEAEDIKQMPKRKALVNAPKQGRDAFERIKLDTYVGMAFSNLVALAIMVTTAATLHAHGITNVKTSGQAAEALKPVAGEFAFAIFTLGIVGTGLLAVPVLAGSAAYALGEALRWPSGLARRPAKAKAFYGTIVVSTLIGMIIGLSPIDPIKALFWSAVINGVVAVPVMAMIMLLAANPKIMGKFAVGGVLKLIGWFATFVMGSAAVGLVVTSALG